MCVTFLAKLALCYVDIHFALVKCAACFASAHPQSSSFLTKQSFQNLLFPSREVQLCICPVEYSDEM